MLAKIKILTKFTNPVINELRNLCDAISNEPALLPKGLSSVRVVAEGQSLHEKVPSQPKRLGTF